MSWIFDECNEQVAKECKLAYGWNLESLLKQFVKEYDFLYDNYDRVAGYEEALNFGDAMIHEHHPLVSAFVRYRQDALVSDREVAAFAFAATELEYA